MFEEAPERRVVLAHVHRVNLDLFQKLPLLPSSQGAVLAVIGCSFGGLRLAVQIVGAPLECAEACAQAGTVLCNPDLRGRHSKVPHGLQRHGF